MRGIVLRPPPSHNLPMPRLRLCVLLLPLVGCGADTRPVFVEATPLNGSTAIDSAAQPRLVVGDQAAIDAELRRVVLYDVTGGGRLTVPGKIEVVGSRELTYSPKATLEAGHEFRLEVTASALTGEFDLLDATESPDEPVGWPYALRFSTRSRPRVRAAYLDPDGPSVTVRFSQPMDPVATGKAISVSDLGGQPVPASAGVVWLDDQSARIDLSISLDSTGLYTLEVSGKAQARDRTLLDGDDDGTPGEPSDDFTVRFTGSQRVIRSRLK